MQDVVFKNRRRISRNWHGVRLAVNCPEKKLLGAAEVVIGMGGCLRDRPPTERPAKVWSQ